MTTRYSYQTKTTSSSQLVDSSRKTTNLLKDNSWIKRNDDEEEDIDRDPNFGRSVLGHYKSGDTVTSSDGEETKTTTTISKPSSVHALTKRFSGQYDTSTSSTLPTSRSTYTRSTYSSLNSPTTRTSVTEEPKTSTTTTTVTKDGKTTETTVTTTQSVRSPTKTETFSERVLSSSKGYSNYSPSKTTKVTETTISSNSAEDKLYDTLIPSSIKDDYSPTDSRRTFTTTETVTVRSSSDTKTENKLYDTLIPKSIRDDETDSKTSVSSSEWMSVKSSANGDITKTTHTTRTSSLAEDGLYDTLLPAGIKSPTREESPTLVSPSYSSRISRYSSSYNDDSPTTTTRTTSYTVSSKPSEDYISERKTYSYSSRPDDNTGDSLYSRSSTKSMYTTPERTVLEKDLCSSCRKPFTGDAKMVLDDMKINCHANCFKCEVCNCSLGHLKAGESLWIYKRMVHCENCFEVTRDKWRR